MHSSSPVRTPKLQPIAEQPSQENVGYHQKKDTPHPKTKKKPQEDCRRDKIVFRINPHTCQRHWEGSNKTLCAPGPRGPTETETDLSLSV